MYWPVSAPASAIAQVNVTTLVNDMISMALTYILMTLTLLYMTMINYIDMASWDMNDSE